MPKKIFNKLSIFITISIVTFNLSAEMPGMSGEIRRDYSDTSFGRVHLWTIGEGPALLLLHQSGQTSDEYLTLGPVLSDNFKVIGIDLSLIHISEPTRRS